MCFDALMEADIDVPALIREGRIISHRDWGEERAGSLKPVLFPAFSRCKLVQHTYKLGSDGPRAEAPSHEECHGSGFQDLVPGGSFLDGRGCPAGDAALGAGGQGNGHAHEGFGLCVQGPRLEGILVEVHEPLHGFGIGLGIVLDAALQGLKELRGCLFHSITSIGVYCSPYLGDSPYQIQTMRNGLLNLPL